MTPLKMSLFASCLLAVAAVPIPDKKPPPPYGPPSYPPPPPPAYPAPHPPPYAAPHPLPYEEKFEKIPYSFSYGVKDEYAGNNFGQTEDSDGKVVQGSYSIDLPDGRTQIVTYNADHYNGYQAQVTYEGEAVYPPPPHYPPFVVKRKPSPYSAPVQKSEELNTNDLEVAVEERRK